MFIRIVFITLFSLSLLSPESAHALVELRANYSTQIVKPDRITKRAPKLSSFGGLGIDAIVSPPLFPLAFGLRYEMWESKKSNSDFGKVEVDITRLSALLSWRLVETLVFVGVIGTFGLSHEGKTVLTSSQNTFRGDPQKFNIRINSSYSLGVEGGVQLGRYLLGAETGILSMVDRGIGPKQKYEGIYGKVHVGVNF